MSKKGAAGFFAALCFAVCAFGAVQLPEGSLPPPPPSDEAQPTSAPDASPPENPPIVQNSPAPIPIQAAGETRETAETPADPLAGFIKVFGFLALVLAGAYFWSRSKKAKA
jgi:hypothetical protein